MKNVNIEQVAPSYNDQSHNHCLRHLLVCGTNWAPSQMADSELGIRMFFTKSLWITITNIAPASGASVKPVHVSGHVIPERKNHGHTAFNGLAELWHATMVSEQLIILVRLEDLRAR